ncbi:hypothetical protein OROGR_020981 [Orobanche gracilis]
MGFISHILISSIVVSFTVWSTIVPQFSAEGHPINVWPKPTNVHWSNPQVIPLSPKFTISFPRRLHHRYLIAAVNRYLHQILAENHRPLVAPQLKLTSSPPLRTLRIIVSNPAVALSHGVNESYTLEIPSTGADAVLAAVTPWGVMRGLETFSQLVYSKPPRVVACGLNISDAPLFMHRGVLLDTSRNYYEVEDLRSLIRAMGMNKLNVFHWHITDSQSFPLVVPSEPELAAKGAYGKDMMYTAADVKKVVEYGMTHGVRVVPEIDMPGMADPTRPEFDILDSEGLEYHRWVSDVETTFVAKDYSATIFGTTGDEPSDKTKASALMFLRRHIDPSLRWEYLQLKSPKELWDALKGRFGNIHNTLLPELTVQWNEIRLLDYKRVNDFNKDMLRLKARLNFCGKEITEDDMIQKTLSTFPTSALILANQYRLEYDNNRITTFNKLINLLQVAERHNEVLVNNNARPAGTKKIPEANYGKVKSGKKPDAQRTDHGNSNPQRGKRFSGRGRGRGRGGSSNVMRRLGAPGSSSQGNHKAPTPHVAPKVRTGDEPCYRCGDAGHWYKNCHASKQVTALYKKYRESKERETHYMEEDMLDESPDVNFTVTDNRNELYVPQSLEAPLYD